MRRRLALALVAALTSLAALALPVAAQPPAEQFPGQIDLPAGWRPEGITAGRGTTVYVGSLADGAIRRVDVRTGAQSTLPGTAGDGGVAGVEYDRRTNRVWVAGGDSGQVRAYDATTGALLGTWTFSPSVFLNDLVATREAVYVTDSGRPELKVIPLGPGGALPAPGAGSVLPLGGDFEFVANEFNANGIVSTGRWLVVVNTFTGDLYRVDPATGVAESIDLGGASVTLGDGLELQGRTLYVVRNFANQVAMLQLDGPIRSATLVGTLAQTGLDIPSTAALQAGRLWAVNARFTTPPGPATPYWITRLPARP